MAFKPVTKAAFLVPSGTSLKPDAFHLHVILTEACKDGQHLIGSIGSIYPDKFNDPTCEFKGGEHSFIKHPSFFEYRRLRTVPGTHLTKCVDGWEYKTKTAITEAIYQKICAGIDVSNFTPQ